MHSWLEVAYTTNSKIAKPKITKVNTYDPDVQLISPNVEFCSGSESDSDDNSEMVQKEPTIEKIILYIQMELCKKTLDDYLNSEGKFDYDERLRIAYFVVKALNIIHLKYDLIHRDITPRNIFFALDGKIKIGDFGLATTCKNLIRDSGSPFVSSLNNNTIDSMNDLNLGESIDSIGEDTKGGTKDQSLTNGIGTKEFVSPEQMSNTSYDQSTDVYSLGLIFLSIFSPTSTQSEKLDQLKNGRAGILPEFLLDHYPQISSLILQMISINPRERPTTKDILEHPLFTKFHRESDIKIRNDATENEAYQAIIMLGDTGKIREMYIRIVDGKLLGYKNLDNKKARFSYPLAECNIEYAQLSAFLGDEEAVIQSRIENNGIEIFEEVSTTTDNCDELPIISHDDVLCG